MLDENGNIESQQCKCTDKAWLHWVVKSFGHTFIVICGSCGKNATARAEKELGITSKDDTLEMAQEHLSLLKYDAKDKSK